MASLCPHGLDPDACVVCAALAAPRRTAPPAARDVAPQPGPLERAVRAVPVDVADGRDRRTPRSGGRQSGGRQPGGRQGRDSVEGVPGRRLPVGSLVTVIVAVVVLAVLAGAVIGTVFALLRIVELVLVGLGAATVGYRVGVARGRRQR